MQIDENEFVIAINKPAGLIVHSDGRTKEPSVADWVLKQYPELEKVGEPWLSPQGNLYPRPGIVHRLDRMTSGVMILAKTQEAYEYLKKEYKERRVEKKYIAVVWGEMETNEGRICAEIARSREAPKRWYAKPCDENNIRAAITDWSLISDGIDPESSRPFSVLEVSPKTGRTHQIRVHMASIGHPLVGDSLYGTDRKPILRFTRPALHATSISFKTPEGLSVYFEAPPPPDFDAIWPR